MKILIASVHDKIPVTNYGGTERVICCLGKELFKLGHEVFFLVKKGSYSNYAKVLFYDENKTITEQIPDDIDVVHAHTVLDFETIKQPYIFTLHGNVNNDFKAIKNTVCISKNHAKRNKVSTYVYNGLDWDEFDNFNVNTAKNYMHFLGKATWKVKNLKDAAKIAVKTNNTLRVLGGEKWSYKNLKNGLYWKSHPLIKYHGMVNNKIKMEIMSHSKGLIFPVKWHEPFGLAIIESMYAGAPVFGSAMGSLPELITNTTGFTSNNIDEIIDAVKHNNFKPQDCRDYVIANFNSKIMTNNYIKLYNRVIKGETLD